MNRSKFAANRGSILVLGPSLGALWLSDLAVIRPCPLAAGCLDGGATKYRSVDPRGVNPGDPPTV